MFTALRGIHGVTRIYGLPFKANVAISAELWNPSEQETIAPDKSVDALEVIVTVILAKHVKIASCKARCIYIYCFLFSFLIMHT